MPPLTPEEQQEIVVAHVPLALRFAKDWPVARRLSFDERVSAAYEGLVEASIRFDPSRGVAFATYAKYWMAHCVRLARDASFTIRVPAGKRRKPVLREAAERASACEYLGPGDDIPSDQPPVVHNDERDKLERAMAKLDPRNQWILRRHICDGATLNELAHECGLTYEGVKKVLRVDVARLATYLQVNDHNRRTNQQETTHESP